jgi:hypothetical protein
MLQIRLSIIRVLVVLAVSISGLLTASAQPSSLAFGTATEIAHVVTAAEFHTHNSTDPWTFLTGVDPSVGGIVR